MINPNTPNQIAAEYEARLAALRQQLAEARRDAARYREALESVATYDHPHCTTPQDLREIATAALKSQSTEPVAWMYLWNNPDKPRSPIFYTDHGLRNVLGYSAPIPLYTTPPTATALVADFKRRAIEVCNEYYEQGNSTTIHGAGERFSAIGIRNNIEALPTGEE